MRVVVYGNRHDILVWLHENVGEVVTDISRYKVLGNGWTFAPGLVKPNGTSNPGGLVELDEEQWVTAILLRWA